MKQFIFTMVAIALATTSLSGDAHAQIDYGDLGIPVETCSTCEPGIPVCSQCLEVGCDGNCHWLSRRLGFFGAAVYDIPLEGIFHSAASVSSTAATLGVDPLALPGGTPIDLLIDERGFDDIYDGFLGYTANITVALDRSTKMYVGYREVSGEADPLEVGQALVDPAGAATAVPIMAQFDDYEEWSVQLGFLTSKAMHKRLELIWGGRGSVGFTNNINGTFSIANVATLADVPFYDDSTILSFGVNLGLRYNVRPNFSIIGLAGAEYRTSLDQNDSALPALGLGNLNNGSGFTSLPIFLGGTINF